MTSHKPHMLQERNTDVVRRICDYVRATPSLYTVLFDEVDLFMYTDAGRTNIVTYLYKKGKS